MTAREAYEEMRANEKRGAFGETLGNLLLCSGDLLAQERFAKQVFEWEAQSVGGGGGVRIDLHLLDCLGTNSTTSLFYDLVNGSVTVSVKKWLMARGLLVRDMRLLRAKAFALSAASFIFYYLDKVKDTVILVKLIEMSGGAAVASFKPVQEARLAGGILVTLGLSLILTEIANFATFFNFLREQKIKSCIKYLLLLLTPLVPAGVRFRIGQLDHKHDAIARRVASDKTAAFISRFRQSDSNATLTSLRRDRLELERLLASLRSNENVLEHFVQLAAVVLVTLLNRTETPRSSPGGGGSALSAFFLQNELLFAASAALSLISLVRGHIGYLSAKNAGFLPIVGKIICFGYFALAVCSRLFFAVAFYAPALGLFGSLHHAKFATMEGHPDPTFDVYDGDDGTLYMPSLRYAWEQFRLPDRYGSY